MTPLKVLDHLHGLPVSHVWRRHGSALFVEFGKRITSPARSSSGKHAEHEITLMIEWSWRIERARSILCGSWSDERLWPKAFELLIGSDVMEAQCTGSLPEIRVSLENGLRIQSFMTAEGQPAWAVMLKAPKRATLSVARGRLVVRDI